MRRNIDGSRILQKPGSVSIRRSARVPVRRDTAVPRLRRPIGLALQGGGSWGAYTWGVLDALLASRTVSVAQISGTSAGAINAAIVASALAKGSAAQARKSLRAFWLRIADPAVLDL